MFLLFLLGQIFVFHYYYFSSASYVCQNTTTYDIFNISDGSAYNSQCYFFNKKSINFDNAENICKGFGGHLASIHSKDNNIKFMTGVSEHIGALSSTKGLWLGLNKLNGSEWNWSDGTLVDYTNWQSGDPFNTTSSNCVFLHPSFETWDADDCGHEKPFSCIIPPTLVITTTITANPELITSTTSDYSGETKATTTEEITTITENNNATTTPSSTTASPLLLHKNVPNSLTKWWIIGGILSAFLLIVGLIIRHFYQKKYRKKRIANLQVSIKIKMELLPLEAKLSHDERLTKQLDSKNVVIDFNTVLGKGANATVYKIFIKGKSQLHQLDLEENNYKFAGAQIYENCHAAIKISTSFDHDEVEQFVRELDALIMIKSHPNIVTFIGWTLCHDMPALATELAKMNLLQYVKTFRGSSLPIKTITSLLWQISQALEYVASLMMVHRDVACRNILLTENNIAKLADFGLCCHCDESFTYQATLNKRMPIKWLSLEALLERTFSEKSDVWSFGIMCYEIFSYGATPYPTMTNEEMVEFLQAGNRLEKSNDTPNEIYDLMLDCWKEFPQDRPKFKEIRNYLGEILEKQTATYGYLKLELDE